MSEYNYYLAFGAGDEEPFALVRAVEIYSPEVWVRMASEWVPSDRLTENLAGFGTDSARTISAQDVESWKSKISDYTPGEYAALKAEAADSAERTRIADENFENVEREQGKLDS